MRLFLTCLAISALGSCAQITGDQWRWMDDPVQQQWVNVNYEGWGREIRFAIPNRLKGSTERVRSNPQIKRGVTSINLSAPPDSLNTTINVLGRFHWDYWWGGFFKDTGTDFLLNVFVHYFDSTDKFLDMSSDDWIEWRKEYWREYFSDPSMKVDPDEYFLNDHIAEPYISKNSLTWIYEYYPIYSGNFFEYHVPISDKHILTFRFHISDVRNGMTPDPAWAQRRLEMAHKIMDTVTVTPSPWP